MNTTKPILTAFFFALCCTITIAKPKDYIKNVVVIYLDNWSFDGLFGHFPGAENLYTAKTVSGM
jgi:phospholipase C